MKNYNNSVYLHLQRNLELPFPFALAKFILVEYLAAFKSWLVEALRYSLDECLPILLLEVLSYCPAALVNVLHIILHIALKLFISKRSQSSKLVNGAELVA